ATPKTKEFQSELLLLSCWNVGNSESFPYSNRNSIGVNCPNEECGRSLLYIHAQASAYFLTSDSRSTIELSITTCRNVRLKRSTRLFFVVLPGWMNSQ